MLETILITWLPAITAILSIVGIVMGAVSKVAAAIRDTKLAIEEVKGDETFKQTLGEIQRLTAENKELSHAVKVLTDEITHIQGYTDGKRGK